MRKGLNYIKQQGMRLIQYHGLAEMDSFVWGGFCIIVIDTVDQVLTEFVEFLDGLDAPLCLNYCISSCYFFILVMY